MDVDRASYEWQQDPAGAVALALASGAGSKRFWGS
jgi:hypothetical protein